MKEKVRNLVLFAGIALVLVFGYLFFMGGEEEPALVVSSPEAGGSTLPPAESQIAGNFLSVLLSIRGLELDESIFSDPAFLSLRDSSIELVPDGNEGRPNPFAPIGTDITATPVAAPVPAPAGGEEIPQG